MRESLIEREVTNHARQQGWFVRKCAWIGRNGAPDRLFSKAGRGPAWVEFKATGEGPRPLQVREIRRMREAGLTVYVINDIETGCALFD